jgi:hypothetical protein
MVRACVFLRIYMLKTLRNLLIATGLCLALPASATSVPVVLSGNVVSSQGLNIAGGSLVFRIMNCATTPLVNGVASATSFTFTTNGGGAVSGSFPGTPDISCGSTVYYEVSALSQYGAIVWIRNYETSGATFNIQTAPQLTVLPAPPTGSSGGTDPTALHTTGGVMTGPIVLPATTPSGQQAASAAYVTAQIALSTPGLVNQSLGYNSTPQFDMAVSTRYTVLLTGNVTNFTLLNLYDGVQFTVTWKQDSTGGHSVAWPIAFIGAIGINSPSDNNSPNSQATQTWRYDLSSHNWYMVTPIFYN